RRVDVIADGWFEMIPRERFAIEAERNGVEPSTGPGSSVWYVSFRLEGPTGDLEVRRAFAASVDRNELVRDVEHGFAEPAHAWCAPSVTSWPRGDPCRETRSRPPLLH